MRKQPQGSRSQVVRAPPSSPKDPSLSMAGYDFVQALMREVHTLMREVHEVRAEVGQLKARLATVEATLKMRSDEPGIIEAPTAAPPSPP